MISFDWILIGLMVFFGIIYFTLIISYTVGWFRLKQFYPESNSSINTQASIIIPARNEEKNIINLLEDLSKQNISKDLFEITVADDQSTDNTKPLVENFIRQNPGINIQLIQVENLSEMPTYKKHAISLAIKKSKGDLIITTDADCRMGPNWLPGILKFYEKHRPKMIIGPVSFHNETSIFEKMQSLEFLSLIAITGGAISIGKPVMCNGANLVYEKSAFIEVGGFDQDSFASGDDVFLLLKIASRFGNRSIRFLKSFNSIVYTEAQKSIRRFYHQRTRWASKNKGYDLKILFVSFSVYVTNLMIISAFAYTIFNPGFLNTITLATLIKVLIDIPILIGITNFVKRNNILLYAIPLIFFYPFYIVLIGALGVVGSYQWKGRKVVK